MAKIIKQCLECGSDFQADTREINRGNAKYCSLKCSGKNTINHIEPIKHICKHCSREFYSKSKDAKYCSAVCKGKNYRNKQNLTETSRSIKSLYKKLQFLPCQICGWNEATRDIHHIIPVSKGGQNEESNLIVVCPNHHRMIHSELITETDLIKYKNQ